MSKLHLDTAAVSEARSSGDLRRCGVEALDLPLSAHWRCSESPCQKDSCSLNITRPKVSIIENVIVKRETNNVVSSYTRNLEQIIEPNKDQDHCNLPSPAHQNSFAGFSYHTCHAFSACKQKAFPQVLFCLYRFIALATNV